MAAAAAAAASPVDLLSHRAAYRLDLARSGSEVARVEGALVIEWRADCSGWLSQQRLAFVSETSEGESHRTDARFSSWEAPDYSRFRFQVRNVEDDKPTAYGGAAATAPGGGGEARYTQPGDQRLDLPGGTLFPTEHVRHLIEAAQRGERLADNYVFDGSGPDALSKVTAVIGGPRDLTLAGGLKERSWPVRLAYYDLGEADALPRFQISFDLGERGVLDNLVLDYGDYALKGELQKLEPLGEPACD